jgi:hypothetical protein
MALRALQFVSTILVALALVPAGAHFFELLNKIDLPQDQYFIVQQIYRGWALFGIVLFGGLAALLALTIMLRYQPPAFWFALVALLCMAATLAIFFVWTYPANVATNNWTTVPANWESLRTAWEYAHAVNAVLTFIALCMLLVSILSVHSRPRSVASGAHLAPAGAGP